MGFGLSLSLSLRLVSSELSKVAVGCFNNTLVKLGAMVTTTSNERGKRRLDVADGPSLLIELGIHLKATQIDQYHVVHL